MIAALGAFDGFHRGHQALFKVAQKLARAGRDSWSAITFSPHPRAVLAETSFTCLFSETEKNIMADFLDIPEIHRITFTRVFAEMRTDAFAAFLEERFFVRGVVVGEDFRFGKGRSGDAVSLVSIASEKGWMSAVAPTVTIGGFKVSSSGIRRRVESGDMEGAAEALGYPFFMIGRVVQGDGRGKGIGFPTANMQTDRSRTIPARGVYAGGVFVRDRLRPAAINVGFNPTFEGKRGLRIEAHIPDFSFNLHEENIALFFLSMTRNEKRFSDVSALVERLSLDVDQARRVWSRFYDGNRRFIDRMEDSLRKGLARCDLA